MRLYRSDAGWQEREKDIRADAVIVSMSPTKLSLGAVASLQSPLPFQPSKIIVPRIVIGGVILDQPAGGEIGAVGVGSLAGTLGFSKRSIMNGPDGKPIHAELALRGTTLMPGPENPALGKRSAKTVGASRGPVSLRGKRRQNSRQGCESWSNSPRPGNGHVLGRFVAEQ
ncbi:MAG TPA: hypothetical protein VIX91_08350 [Candidatus Acidoferrum sp.]